MLAGVEKRVRQRRSHLSGRAERAVVVAAVEHCTPPIEDPIHGPSQARGQAFHPIRQGRGAFRFYKQMDMIVLERVLDDPEVSAFADLAERALYFAD